MKPHIHGAEMLMISEEGSARIHEMAEEFVRNVNGIAKKELATMPKSARVQGQVSMAASALLIQVIRQSGLMDPSRNAKPGDRAQLFQWVVGAIGSATGNTLALDVLGPFAGFARELFLEAFNIGSDYASEETSPARDVKETH